MKIERSRTRTLENYLELARDRFGNEYSYERVREPVSFHTKVEIFHTKCGNWYEQKIGSHAVLGNTCFSCSRKQAKQKITHSYEQFIETAKNIHGDKYDYSKAIYINSSSKVEIGCLKCGNWFWQKVNSHTTGCKSGCPRCVNRFTMQNDEFINKCKIVHGDNFDYSRVLYTGAKTKIEIGCKKCKTWFWQLPGCHHNRKHGCPECLINKKVSAAETHWLNKLNIPEEYRQLHIPSTKFHADALVGNTVYEFYGSYWHGDPRVVDHNKINAICNKTFSDLYKETIEREQCIKSLGYDVKFVWEYDHLQNDLLFSTSHPV